MIATFIRHAEAQRQNVLGRKALDPLTKVGKIQAQELAGHFASHPIVAIFCSPTLRARSTAACLAAPHGLMSKPVDALDEVNFGRWEECTPEELASDPAQAELWRQYNTARSRTRCPGGELMLEVQARAVSFIETTRTAFPDSQVAFVTHGDVIRSTVAHFLGLPLDFLLRLRVDLASRTTLELSERRVELIDLNCTVGSHTMRK